MQEVREDKSLSPVEPLGELPQWARSSVKGSSRWTVNEKVP
ncbi:MULTISPECIES: hypothetical protein [unclassified Tychonema]|nr:MULTISPECIES: hypothetical protein [unclassified Tychonema]